MIADFFVKTRQRKTTSTKTVPITARQLVSLNKLIQASSRSRLSAKAELGDFHRAKKILMYYLEKLALDPETGVLDIDRIATGITAQTRNKFRIMTDIFNTLSNSIGKTFPIDDVVIEAVKQGIKEGEIEELIEKMKRDGIIFEPRRGFLTVI